MASAPPLAKERMPLWSRKSVRLRVVILLAAALSIEGLMRSNLNMAYVCMVKESHLEPPRRHNSSFDACPVLVMGNSESQRHEYTGTLEWSSRERAYLFPVFYFGGLVAAFTTEFLDRKVGSSRAVLVGAVVNVVGTMATPWISVHLGPVVLAVVRFIMGYGQGVLMPAMSVLIARWFPVVEKSTALAIATTGNQISVILSMALTAEICRLPLFEGWPAAFYLYGALGIVLCVWWWKGMADYPSECPSVSLEEREYICGAPALVKDAVKIRRKPKPRWGAVLSSPVVWSICGSSFCHNFIVVSFSTYLPFYYKSVHNMSLVSNGFWSTLPFIVQFLAKVVFASFADTSNKRQWMSVTAVTKICNSTGSFGIACALLALASFDCSNRMWAVAAACTAMAFISGYVPGYNTSVVCVAPSQTAAIASWSRIWAQIGMTLAPFLIGLVVTTGRVDEWRWMFTAMAGLCIITGVFFQCCGSAAVQPWNSAQPSEVDRTRDVERLLVVDSSLHKTHLPTPDLPSDSGSDGKTSTPSPMP